MKSEKEIRQHRDDLRKGLDLPCNCAATGHSYECEQGRMLGEGAACVMNWILGEEPRYEQAVDMARKIVLAYEAKQRRN